MPKSRLIAITTLAALSLGVLGGCSVPGHYEGGNIASIDKHTYVSRPWDPKTIELVDTRDGSIVWSYELPVGKKLAIRFFDFEGNPEKQPVMKWLVTDENNHSAGYDNSIPAPPRAVRKITWYQRPTPEYPDEG